ncbi:MAG: ATP-binding cassette domain-containing protein [Acidimicrobiales bacterium]
MSAFLKATNVNARYGAIQVLRDLSFEVNEGEVVVILGANGAGKTTTLRAVCSMVDTNGSITSRATRSWARTPPTSCAAGWPTSRRAVAPSRSCR